MDRLSLIFEGHIKRLEQEYIAGLSSLFGTFLAECFREYPSLVIDLLGYTPEYADGDKPRLVLQPEFKDGISLEGVFEEPLTTQLTEAPAPQDDAFERELNEEDAADITVTLESFSEYLSRVYGGTFRVVFQVKDGYVCRTIEGDLLETVALPEPEA